MKSKNRQPRQGQVSYDDTLPRITVNKRGVVTIKIQLADYDEHGWYEYGWVDLLCALLSPDGSWFRCNHLGVPVIKKQER
jgi:hypothetical protein